MGSKILHIGHLDKFISDFIKVVEDNFDISQHEYRFFGKKEKYSIKNRSRVYIEHDLSWFNLVMMFNLVRAMVKADKIIVHGLVSNDLVKLLWLMPWVLKKTYWVMLGLDLYRYQKRNTSFSSKFKEFFRRPVIKNMGHLVTYIKGDYELAQQWYGTKGQYHECFMYPSNLYKEYDVPKKQHTGINILVGNSADPSNNHLDVFDKLEAFKAQDIKIYAPLTYGNPDYAKTIIEEGKQRFGDKFDAFMEHMPFNQYLDVLGKIDIAIFNHKRQQAMGNTITLLGLGKKVFMRSDVTQWEFFKSHDIVVYDIEYFEISQFDQSILDRNKETVKQYFSYENYMVQLHELFK